MEQFYYGMFPRLSDISVYPLVLGSDTLELSRVSTELRFDVQWMHSQRCTRGLQGFARFSFVVCYGCIATVRASLRIS